MRWGPSATDGVSMPVFVAGTSRHANADSPNIWLLHCSPDQSPRARLLFQRSSLSLLSTKNLHGK